MLLYIYIIMGKTPTEMSFWGSLRVSSACLFPSLEDTYLLVVHTGPYFSLFSPPLSDTVVLNREINTLPLKMPK